MQVLLVGGAVRDELLGLEDADKDYVVLNSTAEEMLSLGFKQVGHDFPVFLHPKTNEEYALARTERKSGEGYTGFICSFGPEVTLEEDLKRRDLTINAIAKDEGSGEYIDPYHGITDLQKRILRHVSTAFVEDPLRVLRVARFAARFHSLGFRIAKETLDLMTQMALSGELKALTPERVWLEIQKSLEGPNPHIFISVLHKTKALSYIMPELDALYGVPGPAKWHPEIDSFVHTLMTLQRISHDTQDPVVRFAMLCHDLGKGLTPKELWPHHPRHNERGIEPLEEMCARLKVPRDYEDFAKIVVYFHSYMHHLYQNGAEGIVNLFESLDAYRRPERVKPFALCTRADFLGRKGFEGRPFPRYDYFLSMFNLSKTVNAKEFVAQGLKGVEIGKAMHERRVALVDKFMHECIPHDEITDKANERPPLFTNTKDNIKPF